jgi:hypothetical protein
MTLYMREGDIALHWRFLSAFIRRIVLYDEEGIIELTEHAAFDALHAIEENAIPPNDEGHKVAAPATVCPSGASSTCV